MKKCMKTIPVNSAGKAAPDRYSAGDCNGWGEVFYPLFPRHNAVAVIY